MKCRIENRILRFTEWTSQEIAEVDKRLTWIHDDGSVEKLLFEADDGKPATYWGLHRVLEAVCPFPIELESPLEIGTSAPEVNPNIFSEFTLREHQVAAVRKALMLSNGLNIIPTGGGKCHGRGTSILMFDGSTKLVEDVVVGDQLMGPDSEPRSVQQLGRGREEMVRINPVKGSSWTCNLSHLLSLVHTETGEIVTISVREYLTKTKNFKHLHKLYRVGVEFPPQPIKFDPYVLGIYLAEGAKHSPSITTSDPEIFSKLQEWADVNDLRIREVKGKGCLTWNFAHNKTREKYPNHCGQLQQYVTSMTSRWIPKEYLINSRNARLQLLAGLLDGDGHHHHGFYEIVTKHEQLRDDILFLCRSLGFAAYSVIKSVRLKDWTEPRDYHRISISGDLKDLPCCVERKKPQQRKQIKNVLRTGFTIESLGEGDYFGFELDKDGLYLLNDFTVTHNTICILAVIRHLMNAGLIKTSVIVVPTVNLADQFYADAMKCGFDDSEVGVLTGKTKPKGTPKILIGVVNSLNLKLKEGGSIYEYVTHTDALFFDEVHHLRADTFRTIAHSVMNAKYLLGYSGSPFSGELGRVLESSGDALVYGVAGPPIFAIGYRYLVEAGFIAEPVIFFKKTPGQYLNFHRQFEKIYSAFVVHNKDRNDFIIQYASKFARLGFKVLILVQRLQHAKLLMEALSEFTIVSAFGGGKGLVMDCQGDKTSIRQCQVDFEVIRKQFEAGAYQVLIGSQVMDEGIDLPSIGAVILAGAGKSRIKNIQRLGRGLRRKAGTNRVYLIDFYDQSHVFLTSQSKKRKALFTEIEATIIDNEDFFWKEVITHAAQSKED